MIRARHLMYLCDIVTYPVAALLLLLPQTLPQAFLALICAVGFYTLHKGITAAIHLIYDHGLFRLSSIRLLRGYWRLHTRYK